MPDNFDLSGLLAAAGVLFALCAFIVSIASARRSAAAKRRAFFIAKSNAKVKAELIKAYRDSRIDDREFQIILRTLKQAIDEEEQRRHQLSNRRAKHFIEELHPQKSRRVFEDLAREVA